MRHIQKLGRITLVSIACTALLAACGSDGGGDHGEGKLQDITFKYPGGVTLLTAPTTLKATTTSGLPVTFSSDTPSTCTVSGDQMTVLAAGECKVVATQSGGTTADGVTWAGANDVSQLFVVLKHAQAPVVPVGVVMLSAGETVPLSTVTDGALAATYVSNSPSVCTVSGTTLTLNALGICDLAVTAPSDANYADMSGRAFISVGNIPPAVVSAAQVQTVVLASVDANGQALSYTSSPAEVCTVSGRNLTLLAKGSCNVTASAGGAEVAHYSVGVGPRFLVSGFNTEKKLTKENGDAWISAGSAIDGGWCGGRNPSNCTLTVTEYVTTADYTIRPLANNPDWNANSNIDWAYFSAGVGAPRTLVTKPDGGSEYVLTPFMIDTETSMFVMYGIDPTQFSANVKVFVRIQTGQKVTKSNGDTCYITVSQLPDMASADLAGHTLTLADFAVTDNCDVAGTPKTEGWQFNWGVSAESKAAALNAIKTYGIREVQFAPNGVNTSKPRPNADGSIPGKTTAAYVLPNQVNIFGLITFQ